MQVGELNVKLGLNMSEYQAGLEKAKGSVQGLGRTLRNVFQNTAGFALGIAGFQGIQAAIQNTIGAGMNFDSQMQQARISFETMLGSAQKAQVLLNQLQEFAAKTPFEFPDLQDAAKKMLAFGFSANQIMPTLKAVGDAAAGLGMSGKEGIDRIVIALGQMQAKGKVSAEEMLQLTEAGVPAWDILAKAMGKSTAEVMNLSQKGLIPADKAIQALVAGMEQRFPNMMDKQSKSFAGLMSTLRDNLNMTFGSLMRPAFDWLTNTALPKAIELTNNFTEALSKGGAVEAFKTIIPPGVVDAVVVAGNVIKDLFGFIETHGELVKGVIVGLAGAFATLKVIETVNSSIKAFRAGMELLPNVTGIISRLGTAFMELRTAPTILQGVGGALKAITGLTPMTLGIVSAIGLLALAAYEVYTRWDQIKTLLINIWNSISTAATTIWTSITTYLSGIWTSVTNNITAAWNGIVAFFRGVWNTIADIFRGAWNMIAPVVMAGWDSLKAYFQALFDTVKTIFQAGWETVKTIFATAFLTIYYLVTGQWDKIGDVFRAAGDKIKSIVQEAWEGIKGAWSAAFAVISANTSAAWNYIKGIFSSVWSSITGAVANGWNAVKQWFASASASVKSTVSSMWNSVVSFFASAPGRIMGALRSLWSTITSTFQSIASEAANAGANIVRGLINGVWNLASWARQQISQFFGNIINWAKSILGIRSPSRVFAEIGQNIIQGLAQGIQSSGGEAVASIEQVMTTSIEAATTRIRAIEGELAAAQNRLASRNAETAGRRASPARARIPGTGRDYC